MGDAQKVPKSRLTETLFGVDTLTALYRSLIMVSSCRDYYHYKTDIYLSLRPLFRFVPGGSLFGKFLQGHVIQ